MNKTEQLRTAVIDRNVKKPGLRGKVNAMCAYCIYDPYQSGTWLEQVKKCTSRTCPLYSVRPQPQEKKHDNVK